MTITCMLCKKMLMCNHTVHMDVKCSCSALLKIPCSALLNIP
jgi:hypothetical protein